MEGQRCTRRGVFATLASVGGAVAVACAPSTQAPAERVNTNPAPSGALEWWLIVNNAKEKDILSEGVFKDYLRERPQVQLNLTVVPGWDNHYTKLLGALAAGTPPEIGRIKDYWTSDFVLRDALVNLDPYLKTDKLDLQAAHGPARLVSCREAGKTYALPLTTFTLNQFFNPELLREYGYVKGTAVTPPETWDERRDMARRMTDRSRDRWGHMNRSYSANQSTTTDYMQFAMQNGVEWMNKDLTRFGFNTPEGIETMQHLYDMVWQDQSTIPPGYTIERPRETNRVAMWTDGAWLIPGYRTTAPDMKFSVALNPQKKSRAVMIQGNNVAIFKESKLRDLAWTVGRHLNREASDLTWSAESGYPPTMLANLNKPPFSTDPEWVTVMQQLQRSDSKPYPIVTNYQEMMNVIGEELLATFQNKKTPREGIAEAHRRAQLLLDAEVARRK
ncbi:MAG TPA: extracellular solute-binding protein [Chloroflexota bacterium]|nr:extracellular solute-binding protein [Chloroflexota bacterium]